MIKNCLQSVTFISLSWDHIVTMESGVTWRLREKGLTSLKVTSVVLLTPIRYWRVWFTNAFITVLWTVICHIQQGPSSPGFLIYLVQILELALKKWKLLCVFPYKSHESHFNALEVHYTEGIFWLNHSCPTYQVTIFMADFYDFPNDTVMRGIETKSKVKKNHKCKAQMWRRNAPEAIIPF